jgi:spore coat polysaccharide biosynthesis protein SpsF (cytidylyltransferase family)
MGSSRLPGKMLMDVLGQPLLLRTLDRAMAIPGVDEVVLATTALPEDQQLLEIAENAGAQGFAGDPEDVLDRYHTAAHQHDAGIIIRLTGDCPLLDPSMSELALSRFVQGDVDYVSNTHPPTFPDGLDTEVFSFETLDTVWKEATLKSDREHVTQFIRRQPDRFKSANISNGTDLSHMRWTVDEPEDLAFVRGVYEGLAKRGWRGYDLTQLLHVIAEDNLEDASTLHQRNEGLIKSLQND